MCISRRTFCAKDSRNNVNYTDVVKDNDKDGWVLLEASGVTKSFFSSGTSYKMEAIYTGDGLTNEVSDIIFANEEKDKYLFIKWLYPPEEIEDSNQKSMAAPGSYTTSESSDADTEVFDAGEKKTDIGVE